jgi:hypothetical protein
MAAAFIKKFFGRKKNVPLACSMSLDDPGHVHTAACFVDIQPLSLVELFQSQGCSSCPPAIPKIHQHVADPNLVFLTYNVTYFNHLGWTDTVANPKWDARQKAYVKKWNRNNIFTPQVVVDGVADGTGVGHSGEFQEIVGKAREYRKTLDWHVSLDTNGTELRIDSDRAESEPYDINVIVYDPSSEKIKVGKGPNKGQKIVHQNVVKDIIKVGEWQGGNIQVPLPNTDFGGFKAVAVVQAGPGGPIIAVQHI